MSNHKYLIKIVMLFSFIYLLSFHSLAGNPAKGGEHYQKKCAQCHGANGKPTLPRAANFQRKEGLRVSDQQLLTRIKLGNRSCPAHAGVLREQEIIDLISYLRTIR